MSVAPSTLEVVLRRRKAADGAEQRQVVSRTTDRVHIATSVGREWLYLQNPLDTRRASAMLVDHASRTLVAYDESDLRNAMGIRGWVDVLTLGFDVSSLGRMTVTRESRTADDVRFTRYVADAPDAEVREVWWNPALLLPLEVVKAGRTDGPTVVICIERIRRGVSSGVLDPPTLRYPDYGRIDYPDWLEGLGER